MGGEWRRGGRLTDLAGALAHEDIQQLARQLARRTPLDATHTAGVRLAAVAAVLRVMKGGPELLFIKRAIVEHDPWSGHIAFPGGRIEPDDDTLEDTAVRETREELALDLSHGALLGRLDDIAPRSRALPSIIVRPYVAVVAADVTFVLSREVAATYWVPLSELLHPGTQAEHVMTINGVRARFPAYRVDEHLVWGLTERIVRQLLALLDGK